MQQQRVDLAAAVDERVVPMPGLARARLAVRAAGTQDGLQKPAILLLDDEERILNALKAIFRFKYRVLTATEGAQALEILRSERVHVVVSDQRMPTMSGVDFLKQARDVSPSTMRILLTGFSDLTSIIGSVNEGEVYRFINKPWGNKEIEAIVADAVSIASDVGQDAAAPTSAHAAVPLPGDVPGAGVLVLNTDEEAFHQVVATMGGTCPVWYSRDTADCLSMLDKHNVAVMVAGMDAGRQDYAVLFKLLKQEYPELLTIVMAESADAEAVIELINQAKIYRYMPAPCRPARLRHFIESAFAQSQRFHANPVLLRQQKAEPLPDTAHSASAMQVLGRIKSLRRMILPRTAVGVA